MKRAIAAFIGILICVVNVYAADDIASQLEQQGNELNQKEEIIKKEMERLKALKTEVEDDIVKYNKLLKDIEKSLQKAEEQGGQRLKHVAKAYEAMAPEDAASRLSGLDTKTAVQILLKMNSKKAGLVIGMMEPERATGLTKEITRIKK